MANLAYYRNTLATLSQDDIDLITSYIKAGAGAHGIHCETPYSIKQINAVFALVYANKSVAPFSERILPILTLENAQKWNQISDQFLFVCDRIEACDLRWTEARVGYVETKFQELLAA
jgi:hypothetical protein